MYEREHEHVMVRVLGSVEPDSNVMWDFDCFSVFHCCCFFSGQNKNSRGGGTEPIDVLH